MNHFAPPSDNVVIWKDPKFNDEEVHKLKSKETTNVLIICQGRRIVSHSSILRKIGFFDRLLRECYEDKETQQIIIPTGCEIKIKSINANILDMFIKYLYTGELRYVATDEYINEIILEAKNLNLLDVVEYLLNYKVDKLNEDNWLPFLRLIGNQHPNHKSLLYLYLYTDNNSSFVHSKNFSSLELEELKSMLSATNYYPFRSELTKLEAVICWVTHSAHRKIHINELVNLIQLVMIDRDNLINICERHPKLLCENKMFKIYLKTVSSKSIKVKGAVGGTSKSRKVESVHSKSESKAADEKKNLESSGIKVEAPDPEYDSNSEEDDDDDELEIVYERVSTIYKVTGPVPGDPSMTTQTNYKRETDDNCSESELKDKSKRIKIEAMSTDQVELPSSININLGEINIKEEIIETEEEEVNIQPIVTNETCFKLENVSVISSVSSITNSTVSYDATKDDDNESTTGTELETESQGQDEDVIIDIGDSDDDILITTPVTNDVKDLNTNLCSPLSSSSTKLLFFKKSKNVKSYLMTYFFKNRTHKKIAETNDIADIGIEEATIICTGTRIFFLGGTLPSGVHATIKEKLVLLKNGSDRVKSLSMDEILNAKKALIPVESWKDEPKIQTPRYNFPALIVGNFLYIFGGCSGDDVHNSVEKLNLEDTSQGWIDNEEHLEFYRDSPGAAHLGNYIYIVGGSGFSLNKPSDTKIKSLRDVERFNLKTKTQEIIPSMSKKRSHVCVVAFQNKIYAIGGGDRLMDRKYSTTEIYDPEKNIWEKGPTMNSPRAGGYALVLDDTIYVIGGNVKKSDKSKKQTIERLDVENNEWGLVHSHLPTDPFLFNISYYKNSDESRQ